MGLAALANISVFDQRLLLCHDSSLFNHLRKTKRKLKPLWRWMLDARHSPLQHNGFLRWEAKSHQLLPRLLSSFSSLYLQTLRLRSTLEIKSSTYQIQNPLNTIDIMDQSNTPSNVAVSQAETERLLKQCLNGSRLPTLDDLRGDLECHIVSTLSELFLPLSYPFLNAKLCLRRSPWNFAPKTCLPTQNAH